ncbi:MAG: divalent-cation tolerance protein CutA [Candidatus Omnitrophica bacterium]|nr:divalent-cation tolerance protein CutA [Candidatus Omnitrophota bacterium]
MAIVVFVTIPQNDAGDLSKMLLEEKVCACVNIIKDVDSFFWWEGKIDNSKEALLIIKTKESLFPKLMQLILNNHPYSVPEIISFKIEQIYQPYLEWINKTVNADPYK